MTKTRKSRGSGRSRRRRGGTKTKRGGNLLASVVGALKTALPSIVLYEALKAQGKRTVRKSRKSRGGGKRKCTTKKRKKGKKRKKRRK
tara:strand:+ start:25042 stop:25305 length:264 start_codon:yes stop_codon:yes gene_type:complete